MRKTMTVSTLCLAAFLAGCSDWPTADGARFASRAGPWPELVSLSDVLNEGSQVQSADSDQLSARAAALRARARILRQNATTREQMEALRTRLPR